MFQVLLEGNGFELLWGKIISKTDRCVVGLTTEVKPMEKYLNSTENGLSENTALGKS